MSGKLTACFGNDYKYHVNALYPSINGSRDSKYGIVQIDTLSRILEKLKNKLDELNESNSENILVLFSRLNRSIEQIGNYLNGHQNCSQEDANIYLECIEINMDKLYELVIEIDDGSNN